MAKAIEQSKDSEHAIDSRWKSRVAVISRIIRNTQNSGREPFLSVSDYNERRPITPHPERTANVPHVVGYASTGWDVLVGAVGLALQSNSWTDRLSESLAYLDLAYKVDFYWHWRFRLMRLNERSIRLLSPFQITEVMAWHFVLGQVAEAKYDGILAWATLRRSYNLQIEYNEFHRRAQAFMHRLFCRWAGVPEIDWPPWAYEAECYEQILEIWDTKNASDLAAFVERACNRHTHEARPETSRSHFDFGTLPLMHSPIEILMLYRIRQSIGLRNPDVDHPLLSEPFKDLCAPVLAFPPNDMMKATMERLRADWPDFDDVMTTEALLRFPEHG